jgi:histidinol phosphatase-like enzyme (inositol monophosphatase family)
MNLQKEIIPFIKYLAEESGKIIKRYYRTPVKVDIKHDDSPVTIADKKTEEFLRSEITKKFPGHGIIGEELGEKDSASEYKWVLDPVDGTKSFICGTPLFGTLISLLKNDNPILGAINLPVLNELLIGNNSNTTLNNKPVKVRACKNISDAVLLTTDFKSYGEYQSQKGLDNLISKVKIVRSWGDCYGYYLVATGYADIMIDPIMSAWDKMALIPIIKGAGGIITDIRGNDPVKGTSISAASAGIHAEVIRILNQGL